MLKSAWLRCVAQLTAAGFAAAGFAAAACLASHSLAAPAGPFQSFVGQWTGDGQVVASNGGRERIRCRANFTPARQGAALNQSIVCASQSYRIDISSYAEAGDGDSVQGTWSEATRGVSGHLTGHVGAGRFVGTVKGPGFAAGVSWVSNGSRQVVNIEPSGSDIVDVQIELDRRG